MKPLALWIHLALFAVSASALGYSFLVHNEPAIALGGSAVTLSMIGLVSAIVAHATASPSHGVAREQG